MMTETYRDKRYEVSKYRAAIMFRTVGIVAALTMLTAVIFPQINLLVMDAVLLCFILAALIYQFGVDRTIIHSGQFIADDGEALYVLSPNFNLGYGRRHHQKKHIKSYRFYCIEEVKSIKEYAFGFSIRARVLTATSVQIDAGKELLEEPGALRERLAERGKQKTVLFRLERNLVSEDEKRLIKRLNRLGR